MKPKVLRLVRLALVIAGSVLAWLAVRAWQIARFSHDREIERAEAAVVLGTAVWGDQPSPAFTGRIQHGIRLYNEGWVEYLIFTGGVVRGRQHAEAAVARNYAIERGVPAGHIFLETISTTTYENLVETKKIVEREGFGRLILVSDPLHLKRACRMAGDLGLDVLPSPTPSSLPRGSWPWLSFWLRETYFYASYLASRWSRA